MISFFRKIRQKLLSQNRVTRYLVYAVGEIFLVVIGILIALQVNNWNEQRKIRIAEQSILQNLRTELLLNIQNLKTNIAYHELAHKSSFELLNLFGTDISSISSKSLDTLLFNAETVYTFEVRNGYIKSIISSGNLDYLQNEKLKSMLTSFEGEVVDGLEEFDVVKDLIINRLWPAIDGKISSSNRILSDGEYNDFPKGFYTSDYHWFFQNRLIEDILSNVDSWRIDGINDEKALLEFFEELLLVLDQQIETNTKS
ncbi:MAG: DUF6090 family protein [Algoriphagus sp.]|uniref:DUF6090 family protein n=1 Tax=Algoriphagus sp. TaxID=1872435 RepID=UPI002601E566|nr:DUF6090 family protein [Algoriphagus sp.]MDG1277849.1 DUF6090 family protein [Algoriphagus sp.]